MPAPVIDGVELAPPPPGRLLPPAAFTSPALYDVEDRAIFARSWVHVADLADVAQPGDYATATIGRTPVVVIRDRKTGELRGFLNACRHRGARLVDGRGHCDKQIKCPYHAWSYGTDGTLHGVPYREHFTCETRGLDLIPIRLGVVGPLVFGCLDPAAPPLAEWVGALPAALAEAGATEWELAFELRYELAANWKLFVENANDGYHVEFVHDVLTSLIEIGSGVTTLEPHSAYSVARVNPAYLPPGADPATTIRFGAVFPNLIPVLTPNDLTYLRVDPVAHDKLALFVRSYDSPLSRPFRDFRRAAFEHTTAQDLAVVLAVQRGLQAAGLPPGVYSSVLEDRIGHFERTWAEAMAREASANAERGTRRLAIAP
jgi:phenylpropionate dioxygenase-like ring-hydroxylating dioxygenase large terminal subunit